MGNIGCLMFRPGQDMTRMDQGIVSIFLKLVKKNNIIKITGRKDGLGLIL